jgi:NTP pyrophosphatase (non-canonical NTP hydrolase)
MQNENSIRKIQDALSLKQLFDLSEARWGLHSQLLLLVEELNELAVATLHLNRKVKNSTPEAKSDNYEKFAEEIADVEFMLDEMKYYFQNVSQIAGYRKEKEKRLTQLLEVGV